MRDAGQNDDPVLAAPAPLPQRPVRAVPHTHRHQVAARRRQRTVCARAAQSADGRHHRRPILRPMRARMGTMGDNE